MTKEFIQPPIEDAYSPDDFAAYKQLLPDVLEQLAEPHLVGRIQHLPHDVSKYPFQDPMLHHVTGNPVPLAMADTISPIAQKGYLAERERISKDAAMVESIAQVGELLQANHNVVVVTPHDQLIDVVMALLVTRDLLLLADENNKPQSTAVVLSKMVARLQYSVKGLTIPAIQVIQLFCDDIYLSFPKTSTAKDALSTLPKNMVDRNNQLMAQAIHTKFAQGGVLLGLAATGTTRKIINPATGQEEFAPITNGTAQLMTAPNTYALPVELDVSGNFLVNRIGTPTKLDNADDIAEFMVAFKPEAVPLDRASAIGQTAIL